MIPHLCIAVTLAVALAVTLAVAFLANSPDAAGAAP